tara:strand:- start:362 stop:634 length:273 start_codon:yes stop_codon:yes gene_type:complete
MVTQNWIELPKLVEFLYCSERTVYKLKKANVFVAGEHYYRVREGKEKGKCVYGLEECRKALLKHSAETKKPKGRQYKKEMMKNLVAKEVK